VVSDREIASCIRELLVIPKQIEKEAIENDGSLFIMRNWLEVWQWRIYFL